MARTHQTTAWKCSEDAFLRKNYRQHGARYCAEHLSGRTIAAIHRRVSKIGL